ncbi:MAG: hypothetical protein EAS48_05805 [Chryseobacterium sp.]|nr:MAG: hypothetical protein EAS48_05805 [Chryseobacterium sp.]
MPVMEQSFTTKLSTWEKKLEQRELDSLFGGREERTISRSDILSKNFLPEFIHLVILWGYPRGMRGQSNDQKIFSNIDAIGQIINYPDRKNLNEQDLQDNFTRLSQISGLGISTISKLLYFRTHVYDGYHALILDERLIRVFRNQIFQEFAELKHISRANALSNYMLYLRTMHIVASQLRVPTENLEMFLFTFGNNLGGEVSPPGPHIYDNW